MVQTKSPSVLDEVFELSPKALQDACLNCVTENLTALTTYKIKKLDDGYRKEKKFIQKIDITNNVAERVLEDLSEHSTLRNDLLSLFHDSSKYHLQRLRLPEIHMDLCGQELLRYCSFNLRELELGCTNRVNRWSIRKLNQSFSGSSHSLKILKINIYPAVQVTSGTIFDFVVQFPNLQYFFYNSPINQTALTFTNSNWDLLFKSCTSLQQLHININSSSKEIELDSKIFCQAEHLKSLSLYSALKSETAIQCYSCVRHFLSMTHLRELDLSIDVDPNNVLNVVNANEDDDGESHTDIRAGYVNNFLRSSENSLPLIESLDISGIYRLNDTNIQLFLDSHSNLKFLGLCMLQSRFCVNLDAAEYYSKIKISGCVLQDQIVTALLKYPFRMTYMKEVLKGLFQVSSGWDQRRPYILKIVLEVMERFKGHMQLQMAATACVFHLAKEADGSKPDLHVVLLSEIARVTYMILELNVGNLQMVKNCLLIICTDRILHHAVSMNPVNKYLFKVNKIKSKQLLSDFEQNFDRVAMSRLCLDCMLKYKENVDRHVTRMAVAIVSILACKISSKDTSNLMQEKEMQLLLDIVERRLTQGTVDGTLKFDLSALWNLTDESPQACKLFVDLQGLHKYLRLLENIDLKCDSPQEKDTLKDVDVKFQKFTGDMHIETKVLGLLNNIAEVEFLHDVMLLDGNLMERVRLLVSSDQVQVSYFACGIVANLALRWDDVRTVLDEHEKQCILEELDLAIKRWGYLKSEIVTYRSFKPFYGLLRCDSKPEIQRWAIWAIHHVCSLSAVHYSDLMAEECLNLIENIRVHSTCQHVVQQCNEIYIKVNKWPVDLRYIVNDEEEML